MRAASVHPEPGSNSFFSSSFSDLKLSSRSRSYPYLLSDLTGRFTILFCFVKVSFDSCFQGVTLFDFQCSSVRTSYELSKFPFGKLTADRFPQAPARGVLCYLTTPPLLCQELFYFFSCFFERRFQNAQRKIFYHLSAALSTPLLKKFYGHYRARTYDLRDVNATL